MSRGEVKLSREAEEYLEAIYRLEETSGLAKTMDLVRMLRVTPGSVTNTVENLEKRSLVIHKPYRGVKLTEDGKHIALNILRRHRLAERLLTDFLKISWCDVHELACRLEHAMTDELVSAIEKTLGYPTMCPHGNPIPSKDGTITKDEKLIPLTQLDTGKESVIARITDEKREKLRLLAKLGLKPGAKVNVIQKTSQSTKIRVSVPSGRSRKLETLNNEIAATVWIKHSRK